MLSKVRGIQDSALQTARLVVPGLGEEKNSTRSGRVRVWSAKSAPKIMLSQDVV